MKKMLEEADPLVYYGVINNKDWKGYGFKLENVKRIDPIFIKGQLGLWNYNSLN